MKVVVLTGAGISAESGLPAFRDPGGLWEGRRPEEVATPGAFAADPDLVLRSYDVGRAAVDRAAPHGTDEVPARVDHLVREVP